MVCLHLRFILFLILEYKMEISVRRQPILMHAAIHFIIPTPFVNLLCYVNVYILFTVWKYAHTCMCNKSVHMCA